MDPSSSAGWSPTNVPTLISLLGGLHSRTEPNRIEQSIAEKVRSYGVDNVEMPKPSRIALQERLDAFYRDALSASTDDIEERMR